MIDLNELTHALRLWFQPGDVFEVRVLDGVTTDYRREHVESGYFDYEHLPQVAEALVKLRSYRGAYATVNPVNPALLARAVNRLRAVGREPTTSDTDILCRRWLLVDCDAVRPSGISSNNVEHAAALDKAREIRAGLAQLGWPDPLWCDSGNGAQLMYRIDLPSQDDGLVQRCLIEIAKASDDHVQVDLTVHNPARIWRLPGTMNCKGDSTDDRPHRPARLLEVPEALKVVTETQLREIAGDLAVDANETASHRTDIVSDNSRGSTLSRQDRDFELDDWIQQYCPELGNPQPWKDGRRWVFPVCPFNPEHRNKSAVLIEQSSGAIAFTCHHNGCLGNDWPKLRELREPGCYDRSREDPGVDLTGILKQKPPLGVPAVEIITPPEPEIIRPWQEITSEDIEVHVLKGTLLGELCTIYACVTRPPLPLEGALMKAIVTAACCLTGEASSEELQHRYGGNLGTAAMLGADRARLKINTAGGQVCNVYGMIAANSASGKDIGNLISKFARMHNPCIKCADGEHVIADWDLGTSGSAEGLANILTHKPNGLLCISEMANWLDVHHWQNKATSFLTEAFGQGYYNQNFSDRGRGAASRRVDYCCPNILANIQPNVFDRLVHLQDIDTGFLGRFIFTRIPEFYGNPARFDSARIMEQIRVIADAFLRKKGSVELEEDYSDELQKVFLGNCDPKLNPSWRRLCNEYYPRFMVMLSVNHAVKTQGESVIITDDTRERAKILTLWFFANAEKMLTGITDDTGNSREVEQRLKRIFEIVRDQDHGAGVLTSIISRYSTGTGTTSADRGKLLAELIERQWIKLEDGRFRVLYPPPGMLNMKTRRMFDGG